MVSGVLLTFLISIWPSNGVWGARRQFEKCLIWVPMGPQPSLQLRDRKCPINRLGSRLISRFFHKMLGFKNWSILPNYRSSAGICYVNTKNIFAEVCRTRTTTDYEIYLAYNINFCIHWFTPACKVTDIFPTDSVAASDYQEFCLKGFIVAFNGIVRMLENRA